VLHRLGDWPGRGEALIEAGLLSAYENNRWAATRALAAWGDVPPHLLDGLRAATRLESCRELRQLMAETVQAAAVR
jgi:hypothetical protein